MHLEVRQRMTELDVECMLQRAREKYPEAHPRIISDNGPQFIAGGVQELHPALRHDPCTNRTLADFLGCASERWAVKA